MLFFFAQTLSITILSKKNTEINKSNGLIERDRGIEERRRRRRRRKQNKIVISFVVVVFFTIYLFYLKEAFLLVVVAKNSKITKYTKLRKRASLPTTTTTFLRSLIIMFSSVRFTFQLYVNNFEKVFFCVSFFFLLPNFFVTWRGLFLFFFNKIFIISKRYERERESHFGE